VKEGSSMGQSRVHRYTAAHAIVTWDEGVCRHAAECVRGLPEVFNPKERPWIAPRAATFDALSMAIARCPSGALALLHPDGSPAIASGPADVTAAFAGALLKVRPDGPNLITGDFVVAGPRTATGAKASAALCRCGMSADKPYCDGTHTKVSFRDPGILPVDAVKGAPCPGRVLITPTRNGPLECKGPLTVQGVDGRTSTSEESSLCRCGHSRTKPFCDGSHERVGFKG
jgi:CDGSH-type Zn-finger protein/uncharacterized Fe-S cluster protein YjdI